MVPRSVVLFCARLHSRIPFLLPFSPTQCDSAFHRVTLRTFLVPDAVGFVRLHAFAIWLFSFFALTLPLIRSLFHFHAFCVSHVLPLTWHYLPFHIASILVYCFALTFFRSSVCIITTATDYTCYILRYTIRVLSLLVLRTHRITFSRTMRVPPSSRATHYATVYCLQRFLRLARGTTCRLHRLRMVPLPLYTIVRFLRVTCAFFVFVACYRTPHYRRLTHHAARRTLTTAAPHYFARFHAFTVFAPAFVCTARCSPFTHGRHVPDAVASLFPRWRSAHTRVLRARFCRLDVVRAVVPARHYRAVYAYRLVAHRCLQCWLRFPQFSPFTAAILHCFCSRTTRSHHTVTTLRLLRFVYVPLPRFAFSFVHFWFVRCHVPPRSHLRYGCCHATVYRYMVGAVLFSPFVPAPCHCFACLR